MKKEKLQEFTSRVTQSNRTELVVTIYDIILESLEEAKEAFAAGDMTEWKHNLSRAQGLVMELAQSLDFNYPVSSELLPLYLFVNRKILHASARNRVELLEGLDKVLGNLRHAFAEVSKTDQSGPVMRNTQKVYAGLTYGPGSDLSETFQDSRNRGFQA